MTKILFMNSNCSWNKGSAAQVISTSTILRQIEKEAEITLISHFPELDAKFCNCHDVKIVGNRVLNNMVLKILFYLSSSIFVKLGLKNLLSKNTLIKEYLNSDLIVDLSGDTLSDRGAFSLDVISSIIFASAFKKPLAIYSQSIGPFKGLFAPLARYAVEKADLIVVREEITEKYLRDLGVKSSMEIVPDCAFILEPSSEDKMDKILSKEKINIYKPLVGISANGMTGDENYISVMAQVVDHITKNLGAQVIFVPHVLARGNIYHEDDRSIGKKIYDLVDNKEDISLINGDYSPNDLKGIIKSCDMFIGGRMHANIAALSTHVPTIATSWSHKYQGIMGTLCLDDYVCNIRDIDFEDIKSKINKLWETREDVRLNLKSNIKGQKERVWESGKLVMDLLKN